MFVNYINVIIYLIIVLLFPWGMHLYMSFAGRKADSHIFQEIMVFLSSVPEPSDPSGGSGEFPELRCIGPRSLPHPPHALREDLHLQFPARAAGGGEGCSYSR